MHNRKIQFKKYNEYLGNDVHRFAPDAVIFVPTRELTIQVANIIRKLTEGSGIRCQSFFRDQVFRNADHREMQETDKLGRAAKGVNIMISTLGFLNYLKKRQAIAFHRLSHLVFDEADELFDENFREDIMDFMDWSGKELQIICLLYR